MCQICKINIHGRFLFYWNILGYNHIAFKVHTPDFMHLSSQIANQLNYLVQEHIISYEMCSLIKHYIKDTN